MKCHHCKEDLEYVWCLESHGRAYCSDQCFTNRKGESDASVSSSAHAESSTQPPAVPSLSVLLEVQQGHY